MEALTAVSVACLTIYDMAKAVDRGMRITDIRLDEKTGGRSGDWRAGRKRMSLLPGRRGACARLLAGVDAARRARRAACRSGRAACSREDVAARRTQPPFPASAMDGYAVRAAEATAGAQLKVVGMSRAGERFAGALGAGEGGADLHRRAGAGGRRRHPDPGERRGARATRSACSKPVAAGRHIRPAGLDFSRATCCCGPAACSMPRAIALAAAMGHAALPVRRRPRVAILANGDELVPPGATTGPDQIVSSNGVGLAALVRQTGGEPIDLGIAPDRRDAIAAFVGRAAGADILVASGGASVGEHDLVQAALTDARHGARFLEDRHAAGKAADGRPARRHARARPSRQPGLALVCADLFLKPLIRAMLGLPTARRIVTARLARRLPANDERQDYVRARLASRGWRARRDALPVQDSSMLATLAAADALIVRPVRAPAAAAGESVPDPAPRR